MSIYRFISSRSTELAYLKRITEYITDSDKVPPGAIGSTCFPARLWYDMTVAHKKLVGNEHKRQYQHSVLSFADDDKVKDVEKALRIGMDVANLFKDLPTLYSVHTNTPHIHLHFVNSATMLNRKQFGFSRSAFSDFMNKVGDLLEKYGCKRPISEDKIEINEEEITDMECFEIEHQNKIEEDYEIVNPFAKKDGIIRYEDFDDKPTEIILDGYNPMDQYINTVNIAEKNRIYVNNSPELHGCSLAEAQEFLRRSNAECSKLFADSLMSCNNGFSNDIIINFNPKIYMGK